MIALYLAVHCFAKYIFFAQKKGWLFFASWEMKHVSEALEFIRKFCQCGCLFDALGATEKELKPRGSIEGPLQSSYIFNILLPASNYYYYYFTV